MFEEDLMETEYDDDSLAVRVWRVQITPSGYLYCNKAPEMKNRMLREYKGEHRAIYEGCNPGRRRQ